MDALKMDQNMVRRIFFSKNTNLSNFLLFSVKSDDKVMLSKMKYLVEWMYSIVVAKEPETTMQTFLQTIMNIIRKERFKSKE